MLQIICYGLHGDHVSAQMHPYKRFWNDVRDIKSTLPDHYQNDQLYFGNVFRKNCVLPTCTLPEIWRVSRSWSGGLWWPNILPITHSTHYIGLSFKSLATFLFLFGGTLPSSEHSQSLLMVVTTPIHCTYCKKSISQHSFETTDTVVIYEHALLN